MKYIQIDLNTFLKNKLNKMLQKYGTLDTKRRINILKRDVSPCMYFLVTQVKNQYYIFMLTAPKHTILYTSQFLLLYFSSPFPSTFHDGAIYLMNNRRCNVIMISADFLVPCHSFINVRFFQNLILLIQIIHFPLQTYPHWFPWPL